MHQFANVSQCVLDTTAERRGNPGEAQVQLGVFNTRLVFVDQGYHFIFQGDVFFLVFHRCGALLSQACVTFLFTDPEFETRLVLLELCFKRVEFCLVRPGVDQVQRIPFLDIGTFREVALEDITRHTRHNLYSLHRLNSTRHFHNDGHGFLFDLGHNHPGWRPLWLLLGFFAACQANQ